MERLTRKSSSTDMVWFVDHNNNDMDLEPCEMSYTHNKLAIDKLAEYEDTGLTPDEIRVLQEYHDLYTHEDVEASKYVLSLIEADKKKNELSNT